MPFGLKLETKAWNFSVKREAVPRRYFFCGSFVFFVSCASHAFTSVHCYLVVTCWERAVLLGLFGDVYCIFVTFPCAILGQVWYLIVSFPDLCHLSYFCSSKNMKHNRHLWSEGGRTNIYPLFLKFINDLGFHQTLKLGTQNCHQRLTYCRHRIVPVKLAFYSAVLV